MSTRWYFIDTILTHTHRHIHNFSSVVVVQGTSNEAVKWAVIFLHINIYIYTTCTVCHVQNINNIYAFTIEYYFC